LRAGGEGGCHREDAVEPPATTDYGDTNRLAGAIVSGVTEIFLEHGKIGANLV
jgi:hypothetical protein